MENSYKMISKEKIDFFLLKVIEHIKNNNNKNEDGYFSQISKLLNISIQTMISSMRSIYLKALGQINQLEGLAVQNKHLPIKQVELKDISGATPGRVTKNVLIPDTKNKEVIDFSGWNALEFLMYNLFYLTELYACIHDNKLPLPESLDIDVTTVLDLIKHEIWICSNSYKLRKAYGERLKDKKQLNQLISEFLNEIRNQHENEYEYCIPCGNKDHAVYLIIVYDKTLSQLIIRVDNSSQEKFYGYLPIDLNNNEHFNQTVKRLSDICEVVDKKPREANDLLYQADEIFQPEEISHPAITIQTVNNCVVEGYWRGMLHRLYAVGGLKGTEFYDWVIRNKKAFSAISHSPSNYLEKEHKLRNKMLSVNLREKLDALEIEIDSTKLIIQVDVNKLKGLSKEFLTLLNKLTTYQRTCIRIDEYLSLNETEIFKKLIRANILSAQVKIRTNFEYVEIVPVNSKLNQDNKENSESKSKNATNVINNPIDDLVKRKIILADILASIQTTHIYGITGIAGSGKTKLAWYAIYELLEKNFEPKNDVLKQKFFSESVASCQQFFLKEFFVTDIDNLKTNLRNFITEYGFYTEKNVKLTKLSTNELFDIIVDSYKIIINKPFIFIFDNVDLEEVSECIKYFITHHFNFINDNGLVFITSQIKNLLDNANNGYKSISLNRGMYLRECFELLGKSSEYNELISFTNLKLQKNSDELDVSDIPTIEACIQQKAIEEQSKYINDIQDIVKLIEEFSGLPFGLRVAYLYITRSKNIISFKDYLQILENEKINFERDEEFYNNLKNYLPKTDTYIAQKQLLTQIAAISLIFTKISDKNLKGYTISLLQILKIISFCDSKNIPKFFIEKILERHIDTDKSNKKKNFICNHNSVVQTFILELTKFSLIAEFIKIRINNETNKLKFTDITLISIHQITKTALQIEIGKENAEKLIKEAWETFVVSLKTSTIDSSEALRFRLMREHFISLLTTSRLLHENVTDDIALANSCIDMVYDVISSYRFYEKYRAILEARYTNNTYDKWKRIDIVIYSKILINVISCLAESNDERLYLVLPDPKIKDFFEYLRNGFVESENVINLNTNENYLLLTNISRYFLYKKKSTVRKHNDKKEISSSLQSSNTSVLFYNILITYKNEISANTTASRISIEYLLTLVDCDYILMSEKGLTANSSLVAEDYLLNNPSSFIPYSIKKASKHFTSKSAINSYEKSAEESLNLLKEKLENKDTIANCFYLVEVYFLQAILHLHSGSLSLIDELLNKIEILFKKYTFINWNYTTFYLFQAVFYITLYEEDNESKNIHLALEALNKIIVKYSLNYPGIVHVYIGYCNLLLKNYQDAVEEYNKYLSNLPSHKGNINQIHNNELNKLDRYLSNEVKRELFFISRDIELINHISSLSIVNFYKNLAKCYTYIATLDSFQKAYEILYSAIKIQILENYSQDYISSLEAIEDSKQLGELSGKIGLTDKSTLYEEVIGDTAVQRLHAFYIESQALALSSFNKEKSKLLYIKAASLFYELIQFTLKDSKSIWENLYHSAHCYFLSHNYKKAVKTYHELYESNNNIEITLQDNFPVLEYLISLPHTINESIKDNDYQTIQDIVTGIINIDKAYSYINYDSCIEELHNAGNYLYTSATDKSEIRHTLIDFYEKLLHFAASPESISESIFELANIHFDYKHYLTAIKNYLRYINNIKISNSVNLERAKKCLTESLEKLSLDSLKRNAIGTSSSSSLTIISDFNGTEMDIEEVLQIYSKSLLFIQPTSSIYLNLSIIYLHVGNHIEAIRSIENGIRLLDQTITEKDPTTKVLSKIYNSSLTKKQSAYSTYIHELYEVYSKYLKHLLFYKIPDIKPTAENRKSELDNAKSYLAKFSIIVTENDKNLMDFKEQLFELEGDLDNTIKNYRQSLKKNYDKSMTGAFVSLIFKPVPTISLDKFFDALKSKSNIFIRSFYEHLNRFSKMDEQTIIDLIEDFKTLVRLEPDKYSYCYYIIVHLRFLIHKYDDALKRLATLKNYQSIHNKYALFLLEGNCKFHLYKYYKSKEDLTNAELNLEEAFNCFTHALLNNPTTFDIAKDFDKAMLELLARASWIYIATRKLKKLLVSSEEDIHQKINLLYDNFSRITHFSSLDSFVAYNKLLGIFTYRKSRFLYKYSLYQLPLAPPKTLQSVFKKFKDSFELFRSYYDKWVQNLSNSEFSDYVEISFYEPSLVRLEQNDRYYFSTFTKYKIIKIDQYYPSSQVLNKTESQLYNYSSNIVKPIVDSINFLEIEKIRRKIYEFVHAYIAKTETSMTNIIGYKVSFKHGYDGITRARKLLNELSKIYELNEFFFKIDRMLTSSDGNEDGSSLKKFLRNALDEIAKNLDKYSHCFLSKDDIDDTNDKLFNQNNTL